MILLQETSNPKFPYDVATIPYTQKFQEYFLKYSILKYSGNISLSIYHRDSSVNIYYKNILIYSSLSTGVLRSNQECTQIKYVLKDAIFFITRQSSYVVRFCFENKIKQSDLLFELKEFNRYFVLDKNETTKWLNNDRRKY